MILTKTSTNTHKSSFSQVMLIILSPNFTFNTILFCDVLLVLQSDWIAVYIRCKGNNSMYCIRPDPLRASKRVWLRETRWLVGMSCPILSSVPLFIIIVIMSLHVLIY